ncbi:Caffeine dehydrogenase subunit alpha [Candidatus Entotheonellaceae bacterium PAL068K]
MSTRCFGASIARQEDPRLLRGAARYVDDIKLPRLLHTTIVRSSHAHARIMAVRPEAARTRPGVAGIYRFKDLVLWMKPMPTFGMAPPPLDTRIDLDMRPTPQYPLARNRVRYVGEPIAVVVARSRAEAEDAAEHVEVAYEPLPAVVDAATALGPGCASVYTPRSRSRTSQRRPADASRYLAR